MFVLSTDTEFGSIIHSTLYLGSIVPLVIAVVAEFDVLTLNAFSPEYTCSVAYIFNHPDCPADSIPVSVGILLNAGPRSNSVIDVAPKS